MHPSLIRCLLENSGTSASILLLRISTMRPILNAGEAVSPGHSLGSAPQASGWQHRDTLERPFSTSPGTDPFKTALKSDCLRGGLPAS